MVQKEKGNIIIGRPREQLQPCLQDLKKVLLLKMWTSPRERAEKEQAGLVPLLTGGKLKSYKIKGVKWLISLWQNGLNGILADQMGLGETIQTSSFLAHLKGKGLDGPQLVIAPLSTLSNLANEIARFVPSINAIIYQEIKYEWSLCQEKLAPNFL